MNLILVPTIFLPLTGSIQSNDEITLSALNFVALGILILFSAFASGSEAAFFSIGPKEKEQLKNDESKSSQLVLKLLENPKELLATLLITNNFVNVGIVILSSAMVNSYFENLFYQKRFTHRTSNGIPNKYSETHSAFILAELLFSEWN